MRNLTVNDAARIGGNGAIEPEVGMTARREAVMRLIGQGCDDEAIARCLNLTSNGTAIRCDDGQPWTPERVRSYRRGAGL